MKTGNHNLKAIALTAALSPGGSENRSSSVRTTEDGDCSKNFRLKEDAPLLFPLLGGELQSEGEPKYHLRPDCFVVRQRAFTLLELLLAILVFSIVLGAMHVVFFSALKLRNKTCDAIERSLPLQQALGLIKRDLANIVPPGGLLSGALQSTPTVSTTAAGVGGSLNHGNGPQFYTAVGIVDDNAPWGEVERVSYYLAPPTNNAPGMDLFRSVTRNLLPVMQDQAEDQFLMSGVQAITFQYYDGGAWKDTWDSTQPDSMTGLTNNLPCAIKMNLELFNENPSLGSPAPVELIVPLLVHGRTNVTATIE
jgi:type II secretion system protein J